MDFRAVDTLTLFQSKLEQGMVFRLKGPLPFSSNKYHVFVVLNKTPEATQLLLVNGSSQYQKSIQRLATQGIDSNKTTVAIFANSYSFFSEDTIIDCNSVHEINTDAIDFQKNVTLIYDRLSRKHVEEIIAAVKNSPLVEEYIKKQL